MAETNDPHRNENALEKDVVEKNLFICDCCGSCCRHLRIFGEMYAHLDDGNGVCRYFNAEKNLCSIYEERPLICRVDEGYSAFFSHIPRAAYIKATHLACRKLKDLDRIEHGNA